MNEKNEHSYTSSKLRVFDDVFLHLNSFGKYQRILFFSVHLMIFPIAMQFDALVFGFSTPHFHCITANVTCADKKCCTDCKEYKFDGPFHSTVSEWNLICDRAYLAATIQSCYFIGMLLGSFITGIVSDTWGRKKCIFASNTIMLIAGISSSFVNSISLLAFLRFVVGFFLTGVMVPLFVYVMEFVGPSWRTGAGNFNMFCFSFAGIWTTFCAHFIRDWRWFLFVCTAPAALLLPFWKVFPESPRWLIANGRLDEALAVLMKYGCKDGQPVDEEKLRNILQDIRRDELATMEEHKKYTPLDLVKTPKMRKWTLIMCYQWLAVALVSFGILLFVTQLAGSPYINFLIMNGAAALKIVITFTVYLKFGRRITHAGFIVITGVVLLIILAVQDDYPLATTALALTGYITIDCNWIGVYIITSELLPTVIRNTGQGIGSATARVGAILAPYISMMSQLPGLGLAFPVVIFGVVALIAGIFMYWIPETLFQPMHQTIREAEQADEDFGIPCCGKRPPSQRVLVRLNDYDDGGEIDNNYELTNL